MLRKLLNGINTLLKPTGLKMVRERSILDFHLHQYQSYEEYKEVQIHHNMRKIEHIWADEQTLGLMCDSLEKYLPDREVFRGLCHGTRNGFEQNYISQRPRFEAIGTDISPTAANYANSIEWDFHNQKEEWIQSFDFVYSNSLDQSWNPRGALVTWLNQVKKDGFVVVEHTSAHGPEGASEMDPFGVRPTVLPYVLVEWFGTDISLNFLKSKKPNNRLDVWLFFLKKNQVSIF